MTPHEKLMLRRHLLYAAAQYEQRANSLLSDQLFSGHSPSVRTVVGRYKELAEDARMLANKLTMS